MLRELKQYHVSPYLYAFKVAYSGGTPSATLGFNDLSSVSDNGTGDFSLNFKRPFSWSNSNNDVIALASPYHTNGNLEYYASSYTKSAVRIAGAGADLSHDVLVLGWRDRSALNARSFRENVYCNLNRPRMLAFQLDGTTTPASIVSGAAGAFSFTRNSTGNYTLVYKNAFGAAPVVVGCCVTSSTQRFGIISSGTDATKVTFETYNSSGSATNSLVNIFVVGTDSRDVGGGFDRPLQINQRKSILTGFIVDRSGAAILNNSTDATYASGGTGVYTLTLTDPNTRLRRTCTPVSGATNVSSAVATRITSPTSGGFTVTSFATNGAATSSTTHAIAVCYEDTGES